MNQALEHWQQPQGFDLIVVGGGIQGAGIAQAAVAAGYSVLLCERNDWACATSSRSSKLVHGGLRYLESGQFRLVRKALKERQVLLQIAPELVKPVPFVIPLYSHAQRSDMALYTGLHLYRMLGRGLVYSDFDRFDPSDAEFDLLAGVQLERQGLKAIYRYWDAQTDDRLLTRAVVRSIKQLGGKLARGWELIHARQSDFGWRVTVSNGARRQLLESSVIVNAAGPWVSQVQQAIHSAPAPLPTELVQGTHLLIEGRLADQVFYLEAADKRGVFVMPWGQDQTLVGTTETAFSGDPAAVKPLAAEIDYLRATLNRYFPDWQVRIVDAYAGLRVLEAGDDHLFNRSRDTRLQCFWSQGRGLISVYGGKLTTYRTTGQQLVKMLPEHLGPRRPIADTRTLSLT